MFEKGVSNPSGNQMEGSYYYEITILHCAISVVRKDKKGKSRHTYKTHFSPNSVNHFYLFDKTGTGGITNLYQI